MADKSKTTNLDKSLMASLGIDASQVDMSEAKTSTKKESSTPNQESMKDKARKAIKDINNSNNDISFTTLVRDGFLKEANGKSFKLDDKGKKIPRYIAKKFNGCFTIDKQKDGTFIVSKVNYYTESYTCVDYVELGKMQTSEEVEKEVLKAK